MSPSAFLPASHRKRQQAPPRSSGVWVGSRSVSEMCFPVSRHVDAQTGSGNPGRATAETGFRPPRDDPHEDFSIGTRPPFRPADRLLGRSRGGEGSSRRAKRLRARPRVGFGRPARVRSQQAHRPHRAASSSFIASNGATRTCGRADRRARCDTRSRSRRSAFVDQDLCFERIADGGAERLLQSR